MTSPFTHAEMKARQKALGPSGPDGPIDDGGIVDDEVLNAEAAEEETASSDVVGGSSTSVKQSNIPGAKRKIVLRKLRNSAEGLKAFTDQLRAEYSEPGDEDLTDEDIRQAVYNIESENLPDLTPDKFMTGVYAAYSDDVDKKLLEQSRAGYRRVKDDDDLVDKLYNEHMQSAEAQPIDNATKAEIVRRHWPKLADSNVNTDKALKAQYKTAQASRKDTGSYDTWLRSLAAPTLWEKTKTVGGALGHGLIQMGKDVGTAGKLALSPTELMLTAGHAAGGDKEAQEKLKSAGKGAITVAAGAAGPLVSAGLKTAEAAMGIAKTAPLLAGAAEGMAIGGAEMGGQAAVEGKSLGEIGQQTLHGAGMGIVPGAAAGAVHGHVQKGVARKAADDAAKELAELTAKDEAAKLAGSANLSDLAREPLPPPPPTDPLELAARLSREHGWIAAKQNFAKKFNMDPNDVAKLTAPDSPELMDLAAANSRHGVTIDDINDLKAAKPDHLPSTPGAVAPTSAPEAPPQGTAPAARSAPPPKALSPTEEVILQGGRPLHPDVVASHAAAAAPEKIESMATRVNGKIYTGSNHAAAYMAAESTSPTPIDWDKLSPDDLRGVVTTSGRYIGMDEAETLGAKAGQLKPRADTSAGLHSRDILHPEAVGTSRVKQFKGDAARKLAKVESDPNYVDFLVGKGGGQVIGNKKMVRRALGRDPMTKEELSGWNEQTRVHPEDLIRAHVYLDDLFSAFESATARKDVGAAKAINDELNAAMAGYNTATATAGRALQIQDAFSLVKQQHEITQRLLAEGTPMEKIGGALKDALADNPALQRLNKNPAGWLVRRVENAFIQSIFSSPMTHVGNTIGNTLMTAHYMVKRPVVAGLRYMRGDAAGAEAAIQSAFPQLQGIQDGARRFLTAYTEDFPAYKFDERSATELISRNRAGIAKLTTKMGEHYAAPIPLRWASPTRLLAASDNFTKAVHRHTALAESAVKQAKAAGLTGDALKAEIVRLIDNPTPAMEEIADRFGERLTFQEDPGATIEALIQFRNSVPGAKLVLPVMKTPANIARFVVRESPLGVFSPRMHSALRGKLGTAARDEAIASLTIGTGISAAVVAQVMNLRAAGKITFGIPKNPKERADFFTSGARPNSILIGGKLWVPYERYLSHIGRYIGLVGGVVEAYEQKDDRKGNLHMWRATGHVVNGIGDADYLRNMASLSKALSGDDTEWEKLVQQVGGPLGAPSFVKSLRDIVDPVSRDPHGVAQAVANRIPGLSVNVPAHMSGDVEQITAENPVLRAVNITESQVPEEELAERAASAGPRREAKIAAYQEAERRARLHSGFDALNPEEQQKKIDAINRNLQKKVGK